MAPPASDDDWFEDYDSGGDTEMSDASAHFSKESDPYASDSDGCSARSGSDASDDARDDDFLEQTASDASPHSDHRKRLYTVIDRASLKRMTDEALSQVQSILGCTTTTARALLIFFNWDAEAVLGTIAERGQEEVYRRVGLPSGAEGVGQAGAAPALGSQVACGVCLSDVPAAETTTMDCGHTFCDACWREHLRINIAEGMSRRLKCMAAGCGVVCDEDKVKQLLNGNRTLLDKYDHSLLESYVDDNKRVKWCPSVPHCGNAIRCRETHWEVDCKCGQKFCFACCEVQHSPATCEMLREWEQRVRDGTETASWLNANTKPCPKCGKPVEKNGGCNLVLCRCGQAFCWLCGQATGRAHTWTNIEGHSCGAYKEEAEARANEAASNLKRYLHYLTRFEANTQACKLEERIRKSCEAKADALMEADPSMSNFSWLNDALQQLFLARKCMAYSYIFAYFMFGQSMFREDFTPQANAINQALFEDKQGQLEAEVERLSQLIEGPFFGPPSELSAVRMAIVNLAANIDTRIQKMYEVIECDIAPQVASRGVGIAPYRGRHATATGGEATAEIYRKAAEAGPSTSGLPSSDVVDLTAADSDDGRMGRAKGKAPAASRSKRKADT